MLMSLLCRPYASILELVVSRVYPLHILKFRRRVHGARTH